MSLLILLVLSLHATHAAIHFQRAGTTSNITVKPPEGLVYLIGPLNESICIFEHGNVISQADKSKIECNTFDNGDILITMKNVTKTNAGIYRWAVGSQTNVKTELMTIFVTDTPTTPYITYENKPILQKPFTLQCHSNSTTIPSGHNLTMVYEWTRNRKPFEKQKKHHNPTLAIDSFRWKTRQAFRCTSTEKGIRSPESQPVKVTAEWGPTASFIFPNESVIVRKEGDSINMSCFADCRPTCNATWKREREIKSFINSLFLPSLNRSDQDIYTCILQNKHGRKNLTIHISVEYGPSDMTILNIEDTSQHSIVEEGSPINLQCNADCKPTCNVSWSKDGTKVLPSGHLAKNKAQRNQTGNYTCKASNKYSHQQKTFEIKVVYPAEVTALTVNNTSTPVVEGSNVRLSCEIDSIISTNITWQKNEEVLQKSTLQTMNVKKHTSMDVVDLINIQCSDMGIYRCVAENRLGKNSKEVQLDVNCIPSSTSAYSVETYFVPAEKSRKLHFDITANPKPKVLHFTHTKENRTMSVKGTEKTEHLKGPYYRLEVTYLDTQETHAGDYMMTVSNGLGQYQIHYTLVVQVSPSKPTNLTLENSTDNTITVSFIKGFDGNAEQYFQIKVSELLHRQPIHDTNVTSECENTTCTASVSDLKPGRRYYVQIRAANTAGKYSDYTDAIVVTTLDAPVKAEHPILPVIRRVLIVVGVVVVCLLLAGIIYILTCRPCRRKRIKPTRKMNESSAESETGEDQLDLWESVADDQSMALALPSPDTVVERRLGEYKYAKMRVESVMLTTFTEVEPEPRYINFRLDANVDSQPRYSCYVTEADHVDDAI